MASTSNFDRAAAQHGLIIGSDRNPQATSHRFSLLATLAVFLVVIAGALAIEAISPAPGIRVIGEADRCEQKQRASTQIAAGSQTDVPKRDSLRRSRVRRLIANWLARVLYSELRWVKQPVVCGPDGWLFLQERILAGGQDPAREILWSGAVLSALERRFTNFGHRLLLMPVPRKSTLAATHLPDGYDARPTLDDRAIEELKRRGLEVVDLRTGLQALADRAYHMLGSHWTDDAQLIAARAVVGTLGHSVEPAEAAFRRRPGAAAVDTDLLRVAGVIGPYTPPDNAERDSVVATASRAVADGTGRPEADELVLLGSSFSQRRRISGYLETLLGATVWNGARGGRPPDEVIADFVSLLSTSPVVVLETPLYHLLNRAHERFAVDTLARRPPETLVRLISAAPPELRVDLGTEWTAAAPRTVVELPARRIAHSGDGAVSIRLRGQVRAPARVVIVAEGLGRVRYVWQPETDTVVLPLLDLGPASRRTRIAVGPLGDAAIGVRLDAVEWVSEVAPEPREELGREHVTDLDGSWRAVAFIGSNAILGRDAVLVLRLAVEGGDLNRQIQVAIYPGGGAEPLELRYQDLGRDTMTVSSLRALAGRAVDRVELYGSGAAPDRVLGRTTLHFGSPLVQRLAP